MKKHGLWLVVIAMITIHLGCKKDNNETKPTVITAAGNIQSALDQYRNLLGTNNGGTAGSQSTGRREINWDGVPDEFAAPNNMPFDFLIPIQVPVPAAPYSAPLAQVYR